LLNRIQIQSLFCLANVKKVHLVIQSSLHGNDLNTPQHLVHLRWQSCFQRHYWGT